MIDCTVIPGDTSFASNFIAYADCQARVVGQQGYMALAAGGSSVSVFISILLTILIAMFGYRLLLGGVPSLADVIMALVKVGLTITFATSWAAYQTVIYDVAILSPAELGATIGGASGLPGAAGDLAAHLDAVDQQFQALAIYNANRPFAPIPPGTLPPPLFAGFDTFALGAARVLFLVSAVGGYVITRLLAGLLLALGPLFIAFLLFDATRGLVEGWLKALAATVLGTLAASMILGMELVFLEQWLSRLISVRLSNVAIPAAPAQLLATTTIFALGVAAAITIMARLVWCLRLPRDFNAHRLMQRLEADQGTNPIPVQRSQIDVDPGARSRARTVGDAVMALDRREAALWADTHRQRSGSPVTHTSPIISHAVHADRLGDWGVSTSGAGRRTSKRISASAQMRDRRQ